MTERNILEEHSVVESHGLLGGRSIAASSDGQIQRVSYIVACDFCGWHPLNQYSICRSCRGKLCDRCAVKFSGRYYCRGCLLELVPISKNSFKVLLCVMRRQTTASQISKLTRIPKQDVKLCLTLLTELKLIAGKRMAVFSKRELTAEGSQAVSVFTKVYGSDGDVLEVEASIAEEEFNGGV